MRMCLVTQIGNLVSPQTCVGLHAITVGLLRGFHFQVKEIEVLTGFLAGVHKESTCTLSCCSLYFLSETVFDLMSN